MTHDEVPPQIPVEAKGMLPKRRPRRSLLNKMVVLTLWNLTKKYEGALKKHDVFTVKEAEIDREEVADAFRFLGTPWERVLDGRFYKTLATMQHRRDSQLVAPELTPDNWINLFANEVKRRATPLLFLVSRENAVPSLALPQADEPVAIGEEPTSEDRNALRKYRVQFIQLPLGSLETREAELIAKLQGKRLTFSQLAEQLTNWELDLLSQLIRDNKIPAVFDKTSVKFRRSKPKKSSEMPFAAIAIPATQHEEVSN